MERLIEASGDWQAMRARFTWRVPAQFNIAQACCDAWARRAPGRDAIRHVAADGRVEVMRYGALKQASDRLANSLRARGVGPGDRVAILLPQCPEVMITHFAAMKLGAIVLPLFTLFGPDALAYRLADSGAKAVITEVAHVEVLQSLRPQLPALREIYVLGPAAAPLRDLHAEIARAAPDLAPHPTRAEDPAVLIYTSGTTGPPKGALHAHRFLLGHLPCVELHHEMFPQPGDIGWTPADWAWIGGLMDLAMPCLYYGIPLISHRAAKFDPEAALRLMADQGVRNAFLPPTALKLMRHASLPRGLALRSVGSGGEALGADLHEWARGSLGAPINELYGQTECNLVICTNHAAMPIMPGSMGRAVPGHEVAILDAAGAPLPPGAMGEICIHRPDPAMFLGYWNLPDKTAARFSGDWLRTGDLGHADEQGNFFYAARDDDVITSSGYRIGPSEIEACLTGDPDVVTAAVVGLPDPVRTEIVKAFVVLRPGATTDGLEARLIARVRTRLSPHVAPRLVEVIEALPMTATGKIMRRSLRERSS